MLEACLEVTCLFLIDLKFNKCWERLFEVLALPGKSTSWIIMALARSSISDDMIAGLLSPLFVDFPHGFI